MAISRIALLVFFLTLHLNQLKAQEAKKSIKFVGYNSNNPVFVISDNSSNADEIILTIDDEPVEEAYAEAVVESDDTNSSLRLIEVGEKTEKIVTETNLNYYSDILKYANGTFLAFNEYESLVLVKGEMEMELSLGMDFSETGDFRDNLFEFYDRFGIVNLDFSKDGQSVLYAPAYGSEIRKYDLDTESLAINSLNDLSDGSNIYALQKVKDHYLFLSSNRSPWKLHQYHEPSKKLLTTPFTFGRGDFALVPNATGSATLLIYRDRPFAYHFNKDKFQSFELPVMESNSQSDLAVGFQQLYYSKTQNKWRYVDLKAGAPILNDLSIKDREKNYTMTLEEVENLIKEKKRLENPQMAFRYFMNTKFSDKQPPYSAKTKKEIEKALDEFDRAYTSKVSDQKKRSKIKLMLYSYSLDTANVSLSKVESSSNQLIKMIKDDQLEASPILAAQLVGRISSTNPQKIHPARVKVLKALVDDYWEETDIQTYDQLQASGSGLLTYAYKANENYDMALFYFSQELDAIKKKNMNVAFRDLEKQQIDLLIKAHKYDEALEAITSFEKTYVGEEGFDLEKKIEINIQRARVLAGQKQYTEALQLLEAQKSFFEANKEKLTFPSSELGISFNIAYYMTQFSYTAKLEDRTEKLDELVTSLKAMESDFLYRNKYYAAAELLDEIGVSREVLGGLRQP